MVRRENEKRLLIDNYSTEYCTVGVSFFFPTRCQWILVFYLLYLSNSFVMVAEI